MGVGCCGPRDGEGKAGAHELRWQSSLALHFRGYCNVARAVKS